MSTRRLSSTILLLFFFLAAVTSGDSSSDECVYTLYVETGSTIKAGTDSKISITLGDRSGRSVWISDLKKWGLMGPKHDYYERGNTDIFTGKAPCIGSPLCRINVTSDGSGAHHGWYCNSVEVTSTGPHKQCSQTIFYVDQWLATDAPPYQLTALLDGCGQLPRNENGVMGGQQGSRGHGPLVVRKNGNNEDDGIDASM